MADDVVDKIEHDHREVEELFSEFEASRDRALALKICDELELHTEAEEEEVYPVLAEEAGEEEQIDEAEEEHEEARELIEQIRASRSDEELVSLVSRLKAAVEHHVQEEESDVLPRARDELPPEELEELGERFEAAKEAQQ